MMFLKGAAMCIIGIAAGGMVAAGTFAFIVMLGVFTRLAYRTHTSSYIAVYETAIVIGGTIGNIMLIYNVKMPLYYVGLVIFGLFCGIFVGCLAGALTEVLNVIPIAARRFSVRRNLPYVIYALAAGKLIGSLISVAVGM